MYVADELIDPAQDQELSPEELRKLKARGPVADPSQLAPFEGPQFSPVSDAMRAQVPSGPPQPPPPELDTPEAHGPMEAPPALDTPGPPPAPIPHPDTATMANPSGSLIQRGPQQGPPPLNTPGQPPPDPNAVPKSGLLRMIGGALAGRFLGPEVQGQIERPGYGQKQAEAARQQKIAEAKSKMGLEDANAEHARAQGKLAGQQADTLEKEGKQDRFIKLQDGSLWDRTTQTIVREGPAKPKAGYNLQKVQVKRPGSDQIEEAFADPRNPGRLLSLTGEEMPEGTVSASATQQSAQMRQDSYGEFGNYYRSARGQGLTEDDARKLAGQMVFKKFGVTLGGAEQNIAIKGELSGIGGGADSPRIPPAGGAPPTAGRPIPTQGNPAQPRPIAKASAPALPLQFNDKEMGYVNQFIGQLTGVLPPGRGGMAGQIGIKRGMELIAKRAGVDPMTLNAALVQDKGVAKQLSETVQRTGAIQRLNNTLELHGEILANAAKSIPQTDSPFLNTPVQDLIRGAKGSPELKRYLIAINAVQREYAYLTAGGAQSRAMLPVTVTTTMDNLFQRNSTLGEILAGIDQVKIEAKAETAAMNKTQQDLIDTLRGGIAGRAVSGRGGNQGSPGGGPPQMISVQIPGAPPGQIPASAKADFMRLHPDAVVK